MSKLVGAIADRPIYWVSSHARSVLFVLSAVWSMKETAEADKRGERVPPTYYNITGK